MFAALIAFAAALAIASHPGNDSPVLFAWSQLVADGRVSVRSVVPAGKPCPTAEVGGTFRPMTERAGADSGKAAAAFPITVCEVELAAPGIPVSIDGHRLPTRNAEMRRIAVVGDTGCRIKVPAPASGRPAEPIQDCNDPDAWPWARIARTIAAARPDLVIHVGDYHYREVCDDPDRCATVIARGIPLGNRWEVWREDFFGPAAPALEAAPWVFVRGNHENCNRAGEGWMRMLSPLPYAPCPAPVAGTTILAANLTAPAYPVDLGDGLTLLVADSAGSDDFRAASALPGDTALLTEALGGIARTPTENRLWLASHKPLWFDLLPPSAPSNALQAAARTALDARVEMVLAGHEHAFQTLGFDTAADPAYSGGRPAQVISGGGGTQLEAFDPQSPLYESEGARGNRERTTPDGRLYEGVPASNGIVLNRYSFLLLERQPDGNWQGTVVGPDGAALSRCRHTAGTKSFTCAPQTEPRRPGT